MADELDPGDFAAISRSRRPSPSGLPPLEGLDEPSRPRSPRFLKNDLLLHEAVIKNDAEAVEAILKEPLDVNSRNNYGRAPIHWASSRGSTDIMQLLIEARCDIEAKDKYGMSPILMAAWHGHKDAVQLLIKCGANALVINKKQYTLLMCAVHNNRLDVVNFLLETVEDIEIDVEDLEQQTALFHAAHNGHHDVVKRLIEAGARYNLKNKTGKTPLHAASEKGHVEVLELLLLQENLERDEQDEDGNTALHVAADNQQTLAVQTLLEAGCPPDTENKKGYTALHLASSKGCRCIIDYLLQHGASIDYRCKEGNTALHVSCLANELETTELLMNKGADVNALNNVRQSAIHIAAEKGFQDLCKLLINSGANIEQKEEGGRTPLYIAARGSFTTIVDMIIKTARLDYPTRDEQQPNVDENELNSFNTASRRKWRLGREDSKSGNEKLRQLLWKVANRHLKAGEWKRLAHHWSFTDEQIAAIEHQCVGPAGHKDHAFRMMLIWAHGLAPEVNPLKELYEALVAIDKKSVAESIRKKVDAENAQRMKKKAKEENNKCKSCSIS
ncbi:ankyrin repeat and death domain-containing protein 1A-like isoform X2 [Neocloeon triangulifer]|uniref:ankyrin repeat and death domain-containing protein 1A-like isoform X2 n=1 Tax=Neocloeon triangulifer TaxID=2078957 RepID=UPI00286EFE41|nr:ankyrin repeat and death domain-containing protein 1A-like isoform X2 [Neocloeon triangulifer]